MMLCSVQQKIACVFEPVVLEGSSSKRPHQQYTVLAGEVVNDSATRNGVWSGLPTEKIDGTCCYVTEYNGRPWLWARHDIKPNKAGLKKLRRRNEPLASADICWDFENDFKSKPADWIPAAGVRIVDGTPRPDANGHTPGWVPVDPKSRQHCWHLSAVSLQKGFAFVLRCEKGDRLEIVTQDLADLREATLELIGTHVNGNPYHLGSKQAPLHLFVRHGSIPVGGDRLPIDRVQLARWFSDSEDGKIEGIVWHCDNGELFKLHRHHLQLSWPIDRPRLSTLPVTVRVNHSDDEPSALYKNLSVLNNRTFDCLTEICK